MTIIHILISGVPSNSSIANVYAWRCVGKKINLTIFEAQNVEIDIGYVSHKTSEDCGPGKDLCARRLKERK